MNDEKVRAMTMAKSALSRPKHLFTSSTASLTAAAMTATLPAPPSPLLLPPPVAVPAVRRIHWACDGRSLSADSVIPRKRAATTGAEQCSPMIYKPESSTAAEGNQQ